MDAIDYAAPFIGSLVLETIYWYHLRERLQAAKYRRMLKSVAYWVTTVLMVVVGGISTLILADGKLPAPSLLVLGAAFPSLFKQLVSAALSRDPTKLGDSDTARDDDGLRDYFLPAR